MNRYAFAISLLLLSFVFGAMALFIAMGADLGGGAHGAYAVALGALSIASLASFVWSLVSFSSVPPAKERGEYSEAARKRGRRVKAVLISAIVFVVVLYAVAYGIVNIFFARG